MTTNDPDRKSFYLTLSLVIASGNEGPNGQQIGPFVIGPSDRWAGRLPQGSSGTGLISLVNSTDKPVRITGMDPGEGKAFSVRVDTLEEGKRYTLSFLSSNELEVGSYKQVVRLRTDAPGQGEIPITLEMVVIPPVLLNPAELIYDSVAVSDPALNLQSLSRFLWVRQARGMGIDIKGVSSDLPFLRAKIEAKDGSTILLKVTFTDKPAKGVHTGKISIEVISPINRVMEVPVRVNAQ